MCDLLRGDNLASANDVLFVVGNGFDISHGIKSRYINFKEYLYSKNKNSLLYFLDTLFDNSGTLWGDLESTLGEYDVDAIFEECRPDEDIDYDHYMRSIAAIEDSTLDILDPTLEELKYEFEQWVNSISLDGVQKKFSDISPRSLYLTFNYLETLEKIYLIPRDRVFHIHGSRLEQGDYIFGHDTTRPGGYIDDESVPDYEQEAKLNIINVMNEYVKQYDQNIRRCRLFSFNLQEIKKIIVIGHSLSRPDWPYFREIKKHVSPQVPWYISFHAENETALIKQRCLELQINNYELFEV